MDAELFAAYPPGWPACPGCGRPVLDGHLTCGAAFCGEARERARVTEQYRRRQPADVLDLTELDDLLALGD